MWTVMKKELLELSRDRKTLIFIILLPLLIFPLIFGVVGMVAANQAVQAQEKVLRFAVSNVQLAPDFVEKLHYHKLFQHVEMELDDQEAIRNAINGGEVDFVITLPADYQEQGELEQTSKWHVYYNGASALNLVQQKIQPVFNDYISQIRQNEMDRMAIATEKQVALLTPVELERVNIAEARENLGEKLGGIIPYLLLPLCLTGAMYAAIDLGAGEKERGTLETLLLSPVPHQVLVIGKFAAVMVGALTTASITIFSLGLWGSLASAFVDLGPLKEMFAGIGWQELALIFVLLLPVCAIFSAMLLALSIYARSYKEAQNYMGPLSVLVFVPIMFSLLPGVDLQSGWRWMPITNVSLAIKELLKGTMDIGLFVPILLSTIVIAGALLVFCVRWFSKEDVLFR